MVYRCLPPVVEYYTVMGSALGYSFVCVIIVLVCLVRHYTFLRLSCLMLLFPAVYQVISAMVACLTKEKSRNTHYFIQIAGLCLLWIPVAMLNLALLKQGRSYRPRRVRTTRLFVISAITATTHLLLLIPLACLYKHALEPEGRGNQLYLTIQYIATATRSLAFLLSILYAFFPLITIHSVDSCPLYSIDARTAAIGTYYMIVATVWLLFIMSFDIITAVINFDSYVHVAYFISVFYNSTAAMIFAIGPPDSFVEKMRQNIQGRIISNKVLIVERGVLSSGILEGKVYESSL